MYKIRNASAIVAETTVTNFQVLLNKLYNYYKFNLIKNVNIPKM